MSETNNKQFIFAGGQPGSGKTNLVETIKRDNPNMDFIVIDLDKYRIMHPDFKNIIKQDKSEIAKLTNKFAFAVENEFIRYCLENNLNIINVSTLRNTDLIEETLKNKIIPKGYEIKAYILDVKPEESYLSAKQRYEEQLKNPNEIPRLVTKEFHDNSYRGMKETIKMLEKLGVKIKICKRAKSKELLPTIIK